MNKWNSNSNFGKVLDVGEHSDDIGGLLDIKKFLWKFI